MSAPAFIFVDLLPAVSPDEAEDDLVSVNSGDWKIPGFIAVAPVGFGRRAGRSFRTADVRWSEASNLPKIIDWPRTGLPSCADASAEAD